MGLDYIAFQSPNSSLEDWWRAREYADCVPMGSTDEQGRYMLLLRTVLGTSNDEMPQKEAEDGSKLFACLSLH